jgi:hypothetical protein
MPAKKNNTQNIDLTPMMGDSVPEERRKQNTNYIVHTMRLSAMTPIDRRNAEQIRERTIEYMQACIDDCMKPNMVGYALALGTDRVGLQRMFTDRTINAEAYAEIDRGMTMLENVMIQLMMDSKINPVTAIFLLKNHFSYKDASDVNIHAEQVERVNPTELEDKYASVVIDVDLEEDDGNKDIYQFAESVLADEANTENNSKTAR